MVSIMKIGKHTGSCMNCGEETIRWTDSDAQEFCTKECARQWHGDDVRVVGEL